MKKLAIIGAIVVGLFAIIIVLTTMSNNSKLANNPYDTDDLDQATIDLLDDENYQNIILPAALDEKIQSGEKTIAYMFSPLCSHCKNFTPKLMSVASDVDLQIDQLNVLEYDDAWDKYLLTGTPTLIYFENGQEVTRISGDYPEDDIRAFFEANVLN